MSHADSADGGRSDAVDWRRAPLGELAATALVHAARVSDDRMERHYLEIKGPIDVRSKRDGAKIAKFILGAANRTPELAANAFEGYAVMIIGIDRNGPGGVQYVEAMDVARSVEPFIGVPGVAPAWDLVRVPAGVDDRDVLLIVVEPPQRQRRAPYLCRSDGDGLADGAVYVRAEGETRLAKSAEHELLIARGRADSSPDAVFQVAIESDIARVDIDIDLATRAYISAVRDWLMAAMNEASGPGFMTGLSAQSILGNMQQPEGRTSQEYTDEISDWEVDLRDAVRELPHRITGSLLPPVVVRLANLSDADLHDVELVIHLDGPIRGYAHKRVTSMEKLDWALPEPPRRWGPQPHPALVRGMQIPILGQHHFPNVVDYLPARTSWENSGSVTISIDVGDLRPRKQITIDDEELVLALPADYAPEHVSGTWEITARDHHRVYSGTLDLSVKRALNLTEITAVYLRHLTTERYGDDQD